MVWAEMRTLALYHRDAVLLRLDLRDTLVRARLSDDGGHGGVGFHDLVGPDGH